MLAEGFRRLASLRSARAFHPKGRLGRATLRLDDPSSALGVVLGRGDHATRVRLSRGAGLPGRLPDFLGLALRVESTTPLDLLFTSTGRSGPARWLVLPSGSWTSRPYSTVLPYRTPGGHVLLALAPRGERLPDASLDGLAAAVDASPLAFDVLEAALLGGWRVVGELSVESVEGEGAIPFDPMLHSDPRLRPVRLLAGLREAAYDGSRRGRGRRL